MSILASPEFWTGIVSAIGAVTALVIAFRTRNTVARMAAPKPPASTAGPESHVTPVR